MNLNSVLRVTLCALMLVGAFAVGQHFPGSVAAQARQKWDYQIIKVDRVDRSDATGVMQIRGLTKLGEDGWEVVTMNDSWCLVKRSK